MNDTTEPKEPEVETTTDTGPATPARPRLVRSRSDRMIAGVAGGIGAHLNIDPILVRIAFIVGAFAGGAGIFLYALAWILVPEEGDQDALERSVGDRLRGMPLIGVALFVIGGMILLSQLFDFDDGGIFFGLILIGVGWLLYRDERAYARAARPSPAAAAAPATGALGAALAAPGAPGRDPSYLGRYTAAAALLAVGGAAILDNAGALSLDLGHYPALALTVVGAGLLIGTLWGRSRGLIVLGLLLAPLTWATSVVDVPLRGGFGERFYTPLSPAQTAEGYHVVGGRMEIDLTELEPGADPITVEATAAFGEIEVIVPADAEVEFSGSVGAGELVFFDEHRDGVDIELDTTTGPSTSERHIVIDATASFGRIAVSDDVADLAP